MTRPSTSAERSPAEASEDLGRVRAAWLAAARGETDQALELLRGVLERNPADVLALDLQITLLEGAERHAEMAELLGRRAEHSADLETTSAVLTRLGALLEDELGDAGGARRAYEQALRMDPNCLPARRALGRCYRLAESWTALRELLELHRDRGAAATRAALLCELGELLEEQFGELEEARAAYEQALALGAEDAGQRLELLREGVTAAECEARRRARALRTELARAKGSDEVAIHLQLAELLRLRLGDPSGALTHLRRALELDPGSGAALDRALEIADALGGAFAQLDLVDHVYQRAGDPVVQARLLAQRGDLMAGEIGWREEAVRSWRASLALDPDQARLRKRLDELDGRSQA